MIDSIDNCYKYLWLIHKENKLINSKLKVIFIMQKVIFTEVFIRRYVEKMKD